MANVLRMAITQRRGVRAAGHKRPVLRQVVPRDGNMKLL